MLPRYAAGTGVGVWVTLPERMNTLGLHGRMKQCKEAPAPATGRPQFLCGPRHLLTALVLALVHLSMLSRRRQDQTWSDLVRPLQRSTC
ncbi:hypothetical protein CEP54_015072 [Fusarium duplospermum]|uniref:Uncharacterized protein n=1 Tax=Fusarium duplospermum TaxID=1325734 RepID=A0A428NRV4_9HYPO|nr:hypothetical protein CEP54_015072 [Fusarium duplospermum]